MKEKNAKRVMRMPIPSNMINFTPNESQQGALQAMKHWYEEEKTFKPNFSLWGAAGTC